MALTKDDIAERLCTESEFTKNKSIELVEAVIELIKKSLESGDDILFSGFGKFCFQHKGARRGRNPATNEDLMLKLRKRMQFYCAGKFGKRINGEG